MTQFIRKFSQITDGCRSLVSTGRRLGGNFLDNIHGIGNVGCCRGLLFRCTGDVRNQFSKMVGYGFDLFQCGTGVLGQLGPVN